MECILLIIYNIKQTNKSKYDQEMQKSQTNPQHREEEATSIAVTCYQRDKK